MGSTGLTTSPLRAAPIAWLIASIGKYSMRSVNGNRPCINLQFLGAERSADRLRNQRLHLHADDLLRQGHHQSQLGGSLPPS